MLFNTLYDNNEFEHAQCYDSCFLIIEIGAAGMKWGRGRSTGFTASFELLERFDSLQAAGFYNTSTYLTVPTFC